MNGVVMIVKFYDSIEDELLGFAVIIAKYKDKWVLCRHRERQTLEFPGGHREAGESIISAAERELHEETGASDYIIEKICVYSVTGSNSVNRTGNETFGALFYADIFDLESELHNEIEKVFFFDELPDNWTYPLIQPLLSEELRRRKGIQT